VKSGIKVGKDIYDQAKELQYRSQSVEVACGPCIVAIPEGISLGLAAYRAVRAYFVLQKLANALSINASNSVPPVPSDLVGDQTDPRAGPNKGGTRHTSGPLTPANGGTGDFAQDLDKLTGGVRPAQPDDNRPPGSLVGENGIFGRPSNSSGGSSIDIPGNGSKPHETLHYP
jgi:hypothetical protein